MTNERTKISTVLRRGLRRRCPRCGEGALFRRGIETHDRCSECRLLYQRDYGDTWMFMIITDRIPILIGIAALYFGFRATNWLTTAAFFFVLIAPILATVRERQGLALALDYLFRTRFEDLADEASDDQSDVESPSRSRRARVINRRSRARHPRRSWSPLASPSR